MRKLLLFSVLSVFMLIFTVFKVEQHVQILRGELLESNRQLKDNLDELHVLKAEWAYLTHPHRLEEMTKKYLRTREVSVRQIKAVESVASQHALLKDESVKISALMKKLDE